ncbi:MAG: mannosyltransferase family protein [bacterium]|nr:mannosyltransferase family protein [bacterium]
MSALNRSAHTHRSFTRRDAAVLTGLFGLSRVLLVLAGVAVMAVWPPLEGDEFTHLIDGPPALDMWYRQDAGFYTSIATYGYDWLNDAQPAADMAFLPLYPLFVRLTSGIGEQGCTLSPYLSTCTTLAGVFVSNGMLFGALLLTFDLVRRRWDKPTAWRTALLLLVSPISIFLSGVYTEASFLFWVALTFWLIENKRAELALLPAILAALTRSVGVALYPVLLIEAWRTFRTSTALIPRPRISGALLAVGAHLPLAVFAGYVLFMGVIVGETLAYFSVYETVWGREAGSIVQAFSAYFSGEPVALIGWRLSWFDLAMTILYLALALFTFRLDAAWGAFALFALLIPIASGTLVGMPRFGGVILPFYVLIAVWVGQRRWAWALAYGASAGLALLMLSRFVTWRWVA